MVMKFGNITVALGKSNANLINRYREVKTFNKKPFKLEPVPPALMSSQ
jgi:hypothetical protein